MAAHRWAVWAVLLLRLLVPAARVLANMEGGGGGRVAFELSFCLGFGRSGVCSCWVGVDGCRELGGWLLAWLGLSS
jgi:hypothetical protein